VIPVKIERVITLGLARGEISVTFTLNYHVEVTEVQAQ
jgi:hypothetical protein